MSQPVAGLGVVPAGTTDPRQSTIGPIGELLTSPIHPDITYLAGKGAVFSFGQVIAGVAPGTSGTTTTPNLTVYNGYAATLKQVLLVDIRIGYVSGTIGAGFLGGGLIASAAAPTGGTAIVNYPMGTAATGADASVSVGTGHTVTALSTTSDREVLCTLNATLATAAASGIGSFIDGLPIQIMRWIPSGFAYAIAGVTAAGSSPLLRITGRFIVYPSAAPPS